jgi:hypothetical protein
MLILHPNIWKKFSFTLQLTHHIFGTLYKSRKSYDWIYSYSEILVQYDKDVK